MPTVTASSNLRSRLAAGVVLVCCAAALLLGIQDVMHFRDMIADEHRYESREIQEGLANLHRDLQMVAHLASRTGPSAEADALDYLAARRDQLGAVRWLGLMPSPVERARVLLGAATLRTFDPRRDPALAPLVQAANEGSVVAAVPGTHHEIASLAIVVGPTNQDGPVLIALIDGDDLLDDCLSALSHNHAPHLNLLLSGKKVGHWPRLPANHSHSSEDVGEAKLVSVATLDFVVSFEAVDMLPSFLRLTPRTLALVLAGLAVAILIRRSRNAEPETEADAVADHGPPPAATDAGADAVHRARLWQLGELAATLAHDLGQPLNVIRLTAESAQDAAARGRLDESRLDRALSNAVAQTLRAQTMLDTLVAAARRPATPPVHLRPVEIVRQALSQLIPQMRTHGVRLSWHADLKVPTVFGHAPRLEAALRHLMVNAIEALAGHPVDQRTPTLSVECRPEQDGVAIVIVDNGPGFPEDLRPLLEKPLSPGARRGKGCGLGLALALGVVAEMGGTLSITDAGPGTRVTLALPSARPTLLLVEDDEVAATEISDYLAARGWLVRHALGGNPGLDLFRSHGADAVITDLHMVNGDGWHFIEHLRTLAPDLPIIAVSTADGEDARGAVAAGATVVLRKPVGLADLNEQLEELIGGYC